MKKYSLFIVIILNLIYLICSVNLGKKISKKNNKKKKQLYSPYKYDSNYTSYSPSGSNTVSSYVAIDPNNLYTPLTTGTYSSGGNIYQTNAPAILYGTGYSYGPWQKIPMK